MNKSYKSYRTYRTYILILGALGILGLVLIGVIGDPEPEQVRFGAGIGQVGVIGEIKGGVERIGADIRGRIWAASNAVFLKGENVKRSSSGKDIEELRSKIAVLEFAMAKLKSENEALLKQLEAPLPPDLEFTPARVIGMSRFLYIDKGTRNGVEVGDTVLVEEILVGQIIEVGEETAKVRLLTDPESKVPVRTMKGALAESNSALGLLVGEEGKNLRLEKVLQREELSEGDLVGTSGDGGFPADLLIGKVSSLLSSEKEVYQSAKVEAGIEYGNLLYVFVVQ